MSYSRYKDRKEDEYSRNRNVTLDEWNDYRRQNKTFKKRDSIGFTWKVDKMRRNRLREFGKRFQEGKR